MLLNLFLLHLSTGSSVSVNPIFEKTCKQMHWVFTNRSRFLDKECNNLVVPHSNSISGGYCLASLVAAGYYRASVIHEVFDMVTGLTGELGLTPAVSGSNSGGTMFLVRYFALRDSAAESLWTFPCYLLKTGYRTVCFLHGNFGAISEECYAEHQNLVSVATAVIYGGLIRSNGGPLGVVSSYASVFFSFLNNLPIAEDNFLLFWGDHAHWNLHLDINSAWSVAYTVISPREAQGNTYNFGFDCYLSRGFRTNYLGPADKWYLNMTVYTLASISANTLTGISILPFSWAGKQWDNSADQSGMSSALKIVDLVISFAMVRKLAAQHTLLMTTSRPLCESGCVLLDGGFTDNGPVTPVLAHGSRADSNMRPVHISLLGPSNTMESIKYLMGQGPLAVWTGSGLNLCPFTQVTICTMITEARTLLVPMMEHEASNDYKSISHHYQVYRPDQQVMSSFCHDPLSFDHFLSMCTGDSFCHCAAKAVPGTMTDVQFHVDHYVFILSMVWLKPTQLASRFVEKYVPNAVLQMKYYVHMASWFPDFVAVAPQKGGIGFTKIAGHCLLDYLTYLVERLLKSQTFVRTQAHATWVGSSFPPCGYQIFRKVRVLPGRVGGT